MVSGEKKPKKERGKKMSKLSRASSKAFFLILFESCKEEGIKKRERKKKNGFFGLWCILREGFDPGSKLSRVHLRAILVQFYLVVDKYTHA